MDNNQSIETNPEKTCMFELTGDLKIPFTTAYHVSKKLSRDVEKKKPT